MFVDDEHTPNSVRRRKGTEPRELAIRGSYSVIFVVVLLFLIRPLMVRQILRRADACSVYGLYGESERQCNKALLIDADNSKAWYLLGRVYKVRNNMDMAYGAYQKAAQADPTNVPAHFDLGLIYFQDDRYQEAIPCFEQVRLYTVEGAHNASRDGFSYHQAALDMLLKCYEKTGDSEKAQLTREEIQVFYPDYLRSDNAPVVADCNEGQ